MTTDADWREYELGSLLDFSNGINAGKSAYGHGIPFVNVLEVITKEALTVEDIPGRVSLPPEVLARYRVDRGDVLFNRTSETQGEVALSSVYLGDEPVVFGGFVFRGHRTTSELDIGYSKFAFRSADVRRQLVARGQGGIRANVGQKDLKAVVVRLPSLREQMAIAEALDECLALISSIERLTGKQRAIKQGLMQELLNGRTRLPAFSNEWESSSIGEIVSVAGGGTPSRAVGDYWGGNVPWATIKDISTFNPNGTQEYITAAAVQSSATRLVPAGMPILATRMLVGKAVRFNIDVAINQDLKALIARPFVDELYLCNWFALNGERLAAEAGGSTVAGTSTAAIKALEIALPAVDEQRAIARVLSDIDAEIDALERRLEAARAVKQGMMQELLTGKTRLVSSADVA